MKPTILALALLVVLATTCPGTTFVVDLNGGGDFTVISHALFYATTGDTVLVAPGTYTGELNRDLSFEGDDIVLMAIPGSRDPVVIDAEYEGRCFLFENHEGRGAIVQDIVMRQGYAGSGGCVECTGGSAPTFINCEFAESSAGLGAGMNCESGSDPTLLGCTFRENIAGSAGGGLRCSGASVEIHGCTFKANEAGLGGGVMLRDGSTASVDNTEFLDNVATYSGGFRNEDSWALIENSTFSRNLATWSGGGLGSGRSGAVTLRYCSFIDNTSHYRGAGFACGTAADVKYCTFVGGVSMSGCGIFAGPPQGNMVMTNCIVAFGDGPAMTCEPGGAPTVTRCCFFGNTGGDTPCTTYGDILHENPWFCDLPLENLTLNRVSMCLPENNPWGQQIGAFGEGCTGAVPVEQTSWGSIKAMYR